jgi:hypothetical protein
MDYYEHNAKAPSWELIDAPPIQVTESELTEEQARYFRELLEATYAWQPHETN